MSISYTSRVVCGFKLDVRKVYQQKTKFNEDTGEPYSVNDHVYDAAYVFDIKVADTKDNEDALCVGNVIEHLTIYQSGYDQGQQFLGVCVAEADDYKGDWCEFVCDKPEAVQEFRQRHSVPANWFLVQSCG